MSSVLPLVFVSFLIAGSAAVLLAPTRAVVRSRGVVVAVRLTGAARADCREVELDVMVSRPEGGQFAARETTLIPENSLGWFTPGRVIDMFYRPDDESSVAVRIPPRRRG
ncbi:hypothetical protein JDV09_19790 [Mycobacterium sp. Y57]|uniref:hypothetical protein n=1 Tax=Mycolicibacterium xanthum TaxID=2796469 RepID=UPI001C84E70D|nr:hypothetical protein [Mycolicibacterium xanthum]MBX7434321.1 hypothetical protein [Mycolicibacterium xanthum]